LLTEEYFGAIRFLDALVSIRYTFALQNNKFIPHVTVL